MRPHDPHERRDVRRALIDEINRRTAQAIIERDTDAIRNLATLLGMIADNWNRSGGGR